MITAFGATDIGCKRAVNEDSYALLEPNVYVLADGMGGHVAGEVASNMVVATIRDALSNRSAQSIDADTLKDILRLANERIYKEAEVQPEHRGMGSTATVLHVDEHRRLISFASVGDSRLYRLREGKLSQLTRDDSYVESLIESGEITEGEARVHPMKNMLLRAVGVEEKLEIDTGSAELADGDTFLLTSDGVTNMVEDDVIETVLNTEEADKAAALVNMARDIGGDDNITAIVVAFQEEVRA